MGSTKESVSAKFYDDRYSDGYMADWPSEKKLRVFEVIKELRFPETGDALDFGCGNGVFTNVLKQALPKWNIYGVDISAVAIENAKKRYPNCSFFLSSDSEFSGLRCDFLFTHHVLEHVQDLAGAWREIDGYLRPNAGILHILPCGNAGSLEYKMCRLRENGINAEMGGRFYFEDIGHLRRLTTDKSNEFANAFGFALANAYYSNQLLGALDWISLSSPGFIVELTNPIKATGIIAAIKSTCLLTMLFLIKIARFPANTIDHRWSAAKSVGSCLFLSILLPFYPFSKLISLLFGKLTSAEWKNRKRDRNGSEMYLHYARPGIRSDSPGSTGGPMTYIGI